MCQDPIQHPLYNGNCNNNNDKDEMKPTLPYPPYAAPVKQTALVTCQISCDLFSFSQGQKAKKSKS
jgi:hypothetical protein